MPVKDREKNPTAPTPLARRLVRYVVGFGIGVGLGMAPFLGRIPGMEALLQLFPVNMHRTLIPLSIFLMGIIAVAVQFYSGETMSRLALRRRFSLALYSLLTGLVLFMVLHATFVERVEFKDEGKKLASTPVIIGLSRVQGCECPPKDSDVACLAKLTLEPAAVESCWGSRPIRLIRLALSMAYLMLTGGFAALVGLLLLQEESRRQEAAKTKRRRPPTKASA